VPVQPDQHQRDLAIKCHTHTHARTHAPTHPPTHPHTHTRAHAARTHTHRHTRIQHTAGVSLVRYTCTYVRSPVRLIKCALELASSPTRVCYNNNNKTMQTNLHSSSALHTAHWWPRYTYVLEHKLWDEDK
jgi:hypothetical protein